MKKLLLVSFLLISLTIFGQQKDSIRSGTFKIGAHINEYFGENLSFGYPRTYGYVGTEYYRYPDSVSCRVSGDTVFTEYYRATTVYYTLPAMYADYRLVFIDTAIGESANDRLYVTPKISDKLRTLISDHSEHLTAYGKKELKDLNKDTGEQSGCNITGINVGAYGLACDMNVGIGQNAGLYSIGCYNIFIGSWPGKNITTESYCVIVGSDSAAINAHGHDMIWIVDWCHPLLCQYPYVSELLYSYQKNYIETGKDCIESRKNLVNKVIKTLNK